MEIHARFTQRIFPARFRERRRRSCRNCPRSIRLNWRSGRRPRRCARCCGEYSMPRILGTRTAEMHAALADPDGGPDFAPEPFTAADARRLYEETRAQAERRVRSAAAHAARDECGYRGGCSRRSPIRNLKFSSGWRALQNASIHRRASHPPPRRLSSGAGSLHRPGFHDRGF